MEALHTFLGTNDMMAYLAMMAPRPYRVNAEADRRAAARSLQRLDPLHFPDFLLLSSLQSIWQLAALVFPPSCHGLT